MKTFYSIFFILISFTAFSQRLSDYEKMEKQMESSSTNGYVTQLTSLKVTFVQPRIEGFTSKEMNMVSLQDTKKEIKNGIYNYTTEYGSRADDSKVKVEIIAGPKDGVYYINESIISGDLDTVIKFFNLFWSQSEKKGDLKKGEVKIINYFKDKISLSYNTTTKIAYIKITKA